jgi:OmpA-like transmembrane domain
MNTRIRITAALGFASLLLALPAQAADSGFYLGAGAGQAQVKDQNFSESSTPYRGFAGYRVGIIPLIDLAGEIGYTDLGKAEGSAGSVKAHGADASVLLIFPITVFDLYARLGVMQASVDNSINGSSTSSSAGVYGLGAGVRLGPIGVRAEVNRIDIKDLHSVDVEMLSVYFHF